ncbi:hypothetical protein WR25_10345 [Diploscapter pachys]|uniref:Uncharacterized protein n=1 Tax=Diploscapter pachys TaxID=2018661 RepID=A0A2A2M4Z1_9BILA|nr:hypothetical protein WR25_10345 [Diploscapter pachys]
MPARSMSARGTPDAHGYHHRCAMRCCQVAAAGPGSARPRPAPGRSPTDRSPTPRPWPARESGWHCRPCHLPEPPAPGPAACRCAGAPGATGRIHAGHRGSATP